MKGACFLVDRYAVKAISFSGEEAVRQIPARAAAKGLTKAFFLYAPGMESSGSLKKITELLEKAGMCCWLCCSAGDVSALAAAYRMSGADCVIAAGDGGPEDIRRAMEIITRNPGFRNVRRGRGGAFVRDWTAYIITVPDHGGSGSVTELLLTSKPCGQASAGFPK